MQNRGLWGDIFKGAIAGAAATWMMNQATTWMYEHESDAAKNREGEARGGQTAYQNAADKLAGAAGVALADERRNQVATGIHWATGISAGVLYAVLRRRWPATSAGLGIPYGASFYLALDELMNPLLGLTPGPAAFPWQTHARGVGGHAVLGATTALVLTGLDRLA